MDIINGDFSGVGLGEVGTPPTNNGFETAGGTVGTPAANNDFETGDFTSWTLTGSPVVNASGPTGYYAQLASSQKAKSAAFTVASDAQKFTFDVAAVNSGTFQFKVTVFSGGSYTTTNTTYFSTCPTTCTNWNSYSLNAGSWQGQSIKIDVERFLGDLKVDNVAVMQEPLPDWGANDGAKVSRQTGGPDGAYARTTTPVTSSAFTVDANAQNGEVNLKVDGTGSYSVHVMSGGSYTTATEVSWGDQTDSSSWTTKAFGLGDWSGQSIKIRVSPGTSSTVNIDQAGIGKNVIPGWKGGGINRVETGVDGSSLLKAAVNVWRLYTNSLTLDFSTKFGGNDVSWFRICGTHKVNLNGLGTDIGSTVQVWRNGTQWLAEGAYGGGSFEKYFYVLNSNGASGNFEIRGWPQANNANAATRLWKGPDITCFERVDGPGSNKVLGNPGLGGVTAYDIPEVTANSRDPVELTSGPFLQEKTDIAIPGRGIPLSWTRTYNSQAVLQGTAGIGTMGAKWTHNWDLRLTQVESTNNTAMIGTPGGARIAWGKVSGNYAPPAGMEGTLVKNGNGTWTLTTKGLLVYSFDSSGKWTSIADRNGNTTTLAYNGSNQLSTVTDPGGRVLTLTYTGGRITNVADGTGRSVSYAYTNGDLTTITDVMGGTVSYSYVGHLLTSGTDANGNNFVRNTYDQKGRVIEQLDADNGVTEIDYDTPGVGATRVTDQRGKVTTYYFDTKMRITDVEDDNSGVTSAVYNSENRKTSVTNALAKTWAYSYDSNGNVLTATDPLSKTWTYTYNGNNDILTVTDPLSRVTTFAYTSGNLTSVTDANGKVTSFTVNGNGLVTAVTDPLSHATSLAYDSYGNRTTVTNALSKTWTYAHDSKGRVTSVTDPLSHVTSYTYNNANLALTATDNLSNVTTYTYDGNGNVLTVTDANSKVTTYVYDDKDQLTSVTDDNAGVWSYTYDDVGNLLAKTNPRGKTTDYTYDDLSRLTSETDPLSFVRSYAYDAGSRLTARTDPKSQQIDYTYNDRNELTRIDYPGSDATTFAYNDSGARTQMVDATGTTTYAYDSLYRLSSATFPGSRVVGYGYDDASRRTSVTYPGGSNQVTYAYDNADRLTSVTDWNSNATAYGYDDANRMTSKTLPSGTGIVSSYTYDTGDRLTGITHVKGGSTTIASVAYTLDAVGNRTQRVDQAGTHTYAYDDLYRLTSVSYPGPATTTYAYDAFGNRTSMTKPGSLTTTYAHDDADRITTVTPPSPASVVNYTWDDNGNLTNRGSDSFAWDYEDRMTSATVNSVTTTFAYRGDGLRHSKTTGGNTTTFTWDINAGLPVVLDDGNAYLYGAGLEAQKQGGNWYYYLGDGLGSTMAIVNASGTVQNSYTYDVYGDATVTGSLANEFDFAGQQTDASTGLQYLRARYMDPETGTFMSRDPLGLSSRYEGELYAYAGDSPIVGSDPTGLICWHIIKCGDDDDDDGNWCPVWVAYDCPYDKETPISFNCDASCVSAGLELVELTGEYRGWKGRVFADKHGAESLKARRWSISKYLDIKRNGTKYVNANGDIVYVRKTGKGKFSVLRESKETGGFVQGATDNMTSREIAAWAQDFKWIPLN